MSECDGRDGRDGCDKISNEEGERERGGGRREESYIGVVELGERTEDDGMVDDECWLDAQRLDEVREEGVQQPRGGVGGRMWDPVLNAYRQQLWYCIWWR